MCAVTRLISEAIRSRDGRMETFGPRYAAIGAAIAGRAKSVDRQDIWMNGEGEHVGSRRCDSGTIASSPL